MGYSFETHCREPRSPGEIQVEPERFGDLG
jgi:hypothetical protein